MQFHVSQGEPQRGRMWLPQPGISAANAGREMLQETKIAQLAMDTIAVATGDQTEGMPARQLRKHSPRSRQQLGSLLGVVQPPQLVGDVPLGAGNLCGAIDAIPVRRVI